MQQGLLLEQQQKLILTTEMLQGISMVAMSAQELVEYVHDQIDANPFLEEVERGVRKHPCEEKKFNHRPSAEDLVSKIQGSNRLYGDGSHEKFKQEYSFEKYLTQQPTLAEFLMAQLSLELCSQSSIKIAQYLVGNLDQHGFLCITTNEVAKVFEVPNADVEQVLNALQQCDPIGVGARNITEYLLLQLEARDEPVPLAKLIVANHLSELADGRLNKIAKQLGVSLVSVQEVYSLVQTLRPHIDIPFGRAGGSSIWPEVVVTKDDSGYTLKMQDLQLPELTVNQKYVQLTNKPGMDKDTYRYLHREHKAAQGLIEGISRRRNTLFKVACCIIEVQSAFLEKDIGYLEPLTMKQVAKMAEISESTVSRVVNNNYIQTPNGIFELREFFSSAVSSISGVDVSAKSVERLIQDLISHEDQEHPLSDDEIKNALADSGVNISRRTVNKYRLNLGIPSNCKRKRRK